ncbi:unnamed protein product [Auanema sp. JU1783]|nr:unnamed protein product [Auanema sp. JU1783]
MSATCLGLDRNQTNDARDYYRQVLLPFTQVFNVVHGYAYITLCILGVFANISIVVVLLRPAMRKSPFNLFLIMIAVCDATLMATYLIYKHIEFCHPLFFTHTFIVYTKFYAGLSVFVHSTSLWLTVNMAILRYLVLYRGSRSSSRLPPCNGFPAAIVAIVIATIIAFVGSFPNMLRYEITMKDKRKLPSDCLIGPYAHDWTANDEIYEYGLDKPDWYGCRWERFNFWMAAWVLKLIPCILLTVFMTLLVRMLIEARERRSRLCGGMSTGNSQAERTTAMLTIIVAVFLITELPQGIIGFAAGVNPRLIVLTYHLNNFFDLLSLINSAVNFVLCALMSHVFRREFLLTFASCCPQSSESHSGAPTITTHSSVRQMWNSLISRIGNKNGFVQVPTASPEDKAQSL